MADQSLVDLNVRNIQELMAGLRTATRDLSRETRKANLVVSKEVVKWAKSAARSGTPLQRRASEGLGPSATQRAARVRMIPSTPGTPGAAAPPAFWGMKKRIGWFAGWYAGAIDPERAAGFRGHPPGMPEWVGNSWIAGVAGQGPYVLNDVLADHIDEIEDLYAKAYEAALKGAFPGGFE